MPKRKGGRANVETGAPLDFDREYTLEELLCRQTVDALLERLEALVPLSVLIASAADAVLYHSADLPAKTAGSLVRGFRRRPRNDGPVVRGFTFFPIVHELETVGWLAVGRMPPARRPPAKTVDAAGRFVVAVLSALIALRHGILMTSGLHGRVVEETWSRIDSQKTALSASEAKFRHLSEHLDARVEERSRDIGNAQLRLMQQEKMATIGRLSAGVAHEINNPMGFIASNLNTLAACQKDLGRVLTLYRDLAGRLRDLIRNGGHPGRLSVDLERIAAFEAEKEIDFVREDIHQMIRESMEGAARITGIVTNLKDFAHPGVDRPESVDINANLDATLKILAHEIGPATEIRRRYGDLPAVRGFHQQLSQVFLQILYNALQTLPARGKIDVTTRFTPPWVEIRIADNGPGIPPEHLSRIFEPFFTTRDVGQGPGLGLHLAYQIVERHHGTVAVDSEPGRGSAFEIRLPVSGNPCEGER